MGIDLIILELILIFLIATSTNWDVHFIYYLLCNQNNFLKKKINFYPLSHLNSEESSICSNGF